MSIRAESFFPSFIHPGMHEKNDPFSRDNGLYVCTRMYVCMYVMALGDIFDGETLTTCIWTPRSDHPTDPPYGNSPSKKNMNGSQCGVLHPK